MKNIIQNFDLLYLHYNGEDNIIYFPKDLIFQSREIEQLFVFNNNNFKSSYRGADVIGSDLLKYIFLNLKNINKEDIFSNLSALLLSPTNNQEFIIKRVLNYDESNIRVGNNTLAYTNAVIPFGVVYTTQMKQPLITPNFSYKSVVEFGTKKILSFKELQLQFLKKQKVKRITAVGDSKCLISLRDANGKTINQLPLSMLVPFSTSEDLYFDSLKLDPDNCFIEYVGPEQNPNVELTFYY